LAPILAHVKRADLLMQRTAVARGFRIRILRFSCEVPTSCTQRRRCCLSPIGRKGELKSNPVIRWFYAFLDSTEQSPPE
jgi:hypothetical protein